MEKFIGIGSIVGGVAEIEVVGSSLLVGGKLEFDDFGDGGSGDLGLFFFGCFVGSEGVLGDFDFVVVSSLYDFFNLFDHDNII